MSKKRKCRYTQDELSIHAEATRLRRMTDKQLVEEFHRAAEPEMDAEAPRMAQEARGDSGAEKDTNPLETLLCELEEGKCKGIKSGTIYKLKTFATEMGLM